MRDHGGAPIGYRAFNALRLEAGIPWFGADFDEHQIPHEAALENTHISYTKGCYTGQEIVERVRSRGHVNRRRTGLLFSGAEPPPPGTPLTAACAGRARHEGRRSRSTSARSPAQHSRRAPASPSAWAISAVNTPNPDRLSSAAHRRPKPQNSRCPSNPKCHSERSDEESAVLHDENERRSTEV